MTHTFTHRSALGVRSDHHLVKHPVHAGRPDSDVKEESWYIRLRNPSTLRRQYYSLKTPDAKVAVEKAKILIDKWSRGTDAVLSFQDSTQFRATLTVTQAAQTYIDKGYPKTNRAPRNPRQAAGEQRNLETALEWWGARPVATIAVCDIEKYADHRAPRYRSAELEVIALSNALTYAARAGVIASNPIAHEKPRLVPEGTVKHCHLYAPKTDEALHQLISTIWRRERSLSIGAALLTSAYCGLRPCELGWLRWDAAPGTPGHIRTVTHGDTTTTRMWVQRGKRGQNPEVIVHPAMAAWLAVWRRAHSSRWPDSPYMFPHPDRPLTPVLHPGDAGDNPARSPLESACAQLGITPVFHPHGMRAYYVAVRRAEGILDAQIGAELGQSGGERLVRSTYGDPTGILGDHRLDWMPAGTPPCWSVLDAETTNIVPMERAA